MPPPSRRGFLGGLSATILGSGSAASPAPAPVTLYTFGGSILDPGALLVRNDEQLFPEFRGQDLRSRHPHARLRHRAVDGATVEGLQRQLQGLQRAAGAAIALLTVGGNDLLRTWCNIRRT